CLEFPTQETAQISLQILAIPKKTRPSTKCLLPSSDEECMAVIDPPPVSSVQASLSSRPWCSRILQVSSQTPAS
ncbi:hypothetical protein M378DRAFT_162954, partial [Amanita muscaria Koide BX008]